MSPPNPVSRWRDPCRTYDIDSLNGYLDDVPVPFKPLAFIEWLITCDDPCDAADEDGHDEWDEETEKW